MQRARKDWRMKTWCLNNRTVKLGHVTYCTVAGLSCLDIADRAGWPAEEARSYELLSILAVFVVAVRCLLIETKMVFEIMALLMFCFGCALVITVLQYS